MTGTQVISPVCVERTLVTGGMKFMLSVHRYTVVPRPMCEMNLYLNPFIWPRCSFIISSTCIIVSLGFDELVGKCQFEFYSHPFVVDAEHYDRMTIVIVNSIFILAIFIVLETYLGIHVEIKSSLV